MCAVQLWKVVTVIALGVGPTAAAAQESQPATREQAIVQAEADKAAVLHPYILRKDERILDRVEDILSHGLRWYPYFESVYAGGGFPFGVGYRQHVSPYTLLDVRGSYTLSGYTRAEAELIAPHLFHRRGQLSLLGGWRGATDVGFFGIGNDASQAQRTSYELRQPYAAATLRFMPTRRYWSFDGGLELTRWSQRGASGSSPSVDTVFTPETLPGLGGEAVYVHTQGRASFDWRPSPGYARRGGYYGVTAHDYADTRSAFGFRQVDYEAIQHVPILREAWVISLRALVQTAYDKGGEQIPFFMLPSLGGTSSLRGYDAWRFRDRNSLLLQGEWRIMTNRFLDTAIFYDAGKVGPRLSDLDLEGLRHDYGFGFRFHSPDATVLRFDVARSREGTRLILAAGYAF